MVAMIHFHGTPITPIAELYKLSGRHFCVSFAAPAQVARVHEIGQSVMLDNGAFSAFTAGRPVADWSAYYSWSEKWLDWPTTWAVVPDVIDGGPDAQDELLRQWPHEDRGAPVWHMDEPLDRLIRLTNEWPRVCMGSTAQFWRVLSPDWRARMDAAWEALSKHHRRWPQIHMLRGMQLSGYPWPFASVDSTDVARNHNRPGNTVQRLADRWDKLQCSPLWAHPLIQPQLLPVDFSTEPKRPPHPRRTPPMTNDDDVAREWADMHAATVDGLRRQGWSRCDAVIEADEREAGAFADKEASRTTQDKAD